ncbi:NAD(+) diphosphatase [Actinosynnema sp. NPDC020468]|uniref:NAD(+) diphosphatase n=1 Tax=Actinosynnema sp. NPDC020468 TaxID=3154488 RepID=UPI0033D371A6
MSSTVYYSGLPLDRVGGRRGDAAWVAEALGGVGSRVIPLWRDHCLVRDGKPVVPGADSAGAVVAAAGESVLLGVDGGNAVFAADLSGLTRDEALALAGADAAVDVRTLVGSLPADECGLLAYARGIVHWNRNQRFCGACGSPAESREGGHLRVCTGCGKLLFPRIEPAVIMLVELPGEPARCLLGRHRNSAPDRFSTLAGFVEIGESLEDAVRREVAEEVGVTVGEVVYEGSQSWPFPAGLMLGFRAVAVSDEIAPDGVELVEGRWFTAAELRARMADPAAGGPYRVDSIDRHLIEKWLSENE